MHFSCGGKSTANKTKGPILIHLIPTTIMATVEVILHTYILVEMCFEVLIKDFLPCWH